MFFARRLLGREPLKTGGRGTRGISDSNIARLAGKLDRERRAQKLDGVSKVEFRGGEVRVVGRGFHLIDAEVARIQNKRGVFRRVPFHRESDAPLQRLVIEQHVEIEIRMSDKNILGVRERMDVFRNRGSWNRDTSGTTGGEHKDERGDDRERLH